MLVARRNGLLGLSLLVGAVASLGAACSEDPMMMNLPDGARPDVPVADSPRPPIDGTGPVCVDTDMDGVADNLETTGDTDGDGTPNARDDDSDGDGFSDEIEGRRNYPGYEAMALPALVCGAPPASCDSDATPNFMDTDSDDDGLTDAEEREARSNPCASDTDMDGVPDLTERAAGSDPTSATSMPPMGALYVTLPHSTPANPQPHQFREFEFQTRIRAADIMFFVDTTGSMQRTIDTLRTTLSTRIVMPLVAMLGGADVRYGVADFRDVPNGTYGASSDWILRVRQKPDANASLTLTAIGQMRAALGGDWPESQVEALYQALEGDGITGHESDDTPSRTMGGMGWAGRVNRDAHCDGVPGSFGWGCFQTGRVPILVLFSDADWHNGAFGSYPYSDIRGMHNYSNLRAAMLRRGAYYVGIDVGMGRDTFVQSEQLARESGTLDAMGNPIVFNNPGGGPEIADSVVTAITSIINGTRQNITTRTDPDAMEMRIAAPRTTADFVKAVTPLRGMPDAPAGFDRFDATTFFNVAPSTRVTFRVDFHNDFQPGGRTAQLFRTTIVVLGRANSEVDRRPVFIIVPGADANVPG
ncbi:MAG: hypothetical protein JNK05_07825 [Myxococcales bacterium]|nr:hypothetical protein [Myxococcales bacterium]